MDCKDLTSSARNLNLENHRLFVRALRTLSVPFLNSPPATTVKGLMRFSSDALKVMGHCGSTCALEVMYSRHERSLFDNGISTGLANLFWHHCVSQPKALRNRLHIVTEIVKGVLREKLAVSSNGVKAISVGGGSSRAMIEALSELHHDGAREKVQVITIDRDPAAITLGKVLAEKHSLDGAISWLEGNAWELDSLAADGEYDLLEMVGLYDYFPHKAGLKLLKKCRSKLKEGGIIILGNVHPHNEMNFVSKMGWPRMCYRTPEDLKQALITAGFSNEPSIIFEPLSIHMIALARR